MKQTKIERIILIVICLVIVIAIVRDNMARFGSLYQECPDGNLYISIAENFHENHHFIQTSRPTEVNMVVPFGVPLFYTIMLYIFNATMPIIVFQYFLVGITVSLMAYTARKVSNSNLPYIAVPAFYLGFYELIQYPNPAYFLTEPYTLFLLSLYVNVLFCEKYSTKRIVALLIIGFVSTCVRPVVGILLLVPITLAVIDVAKEKPRKKKLIVYSSLALSTVIILAVNVYVNYRETGYIILMEDYGGVPAYQANNANTMTIEFNTPRSELFTDEYFKEVYYNTEMDMYERNDLLNQRTKVFIWNNLPFVLKNTAIKYFNLTNKDNSLFRLSIFAGCLLFSYIILKNRRKYIVLFGISFVLVTIIPAFGLFITRYSVPCLCFYPIIMALFLSSVANKVWRLISRRFLHG